MALVYVFTGKHIISFNLLSNPGCAGTFDIYSEVGASARIQVFTIGTDQSTVERLLMTVQQNTAGDIGGGKAAGHKDVKEMFHFRNSVVEWIFRPDAEEYRKRSQ